MKVISFTNSAKDIVKEDAVDKIGKLIGVDVIINCPMIGHPAILKVFKNW